jgi:ferrochelatase
VRVAVVMFNLGGPDRPEAVRPFLRNLFSDPAILRVPGPVRYLLAWLIARRRAPIARGIYEQLGGGSPLLPNTVAQAEAVAKALAERRPDDQFLCVPVMRYWHPFASEVTRQVAAWRPDRIIQLPLYPQFSTTTSASSLADWAKAAAAAGLDQPTATVCCWPANRGWIRASAELLRATLDRVVADGHRPRVLFSAHGLPKKIVDAGDPYAWQVERSAEAIIAELGSEAPESVVCYQSRVGPLEWIGPSTEDELVRAGRDGRAVVIYPVAFVSEHSETLVEIEIEYREKAHAAGVPAFVRVPTAMTHPSFVAGLADLVEAALVDGGRRADGGGRLCPAGAVGCATANLA